MKNNKYHHEALTYDDVLLQPQYSEIRSRKDIDIGSDLGKGITLSLPILSAPMEVPASFTDIVPLKNKF